MCVFKLINYSSETNRIKEHPEYQEIFKEIDEDADFFLRATYEINTIYKVIIRSKGFAFWQVIHIKRYKNDNYNDYFFFPL